MNDLATFALICSETAPPEAPDKAPCKKRMISNKLHTDLRKLRAREANESVTTFVVLTFIIIIN